MTTYDFGGKATPFDFQCPNCQALPGDACLSAKGAELMWAHKERTALKNRRTRRVAR